MSTQELIHAEDFVDHLANKWAQKMFYPPRSSAYQLLGQWLYSALQDVGAAKVMEIRIRVRGVRESGGRKRPLEGLRIHRRGHFRKLSEIRQPTVA